jgi:hypothetical protein
VRFAAQRDEPRVDRRGGLGRDLLADDRADERTETVGVGLQPARSNAVNDRPQVRVDPAQMPHRGGPAIAGDGARRRGSSKLRRTRGWLAVTIHFSKPVGLALVQRYWLERTTSDVTRPGTHVLDQKSLAHSLYQGNGTTWHQMARFGAWFKMRLRCVAIRRIAKAHSSAEPETFCVTWSLRLLERHRVRAARTLHPRAQKGRSATSPDLVSTSACRPDNRNFGFAVSQSPS